MTSGHWRDRFRLTALAAGMAEHGAAMAQARARTLAALGVWSGFTTDAKGVALNTKWWPARR